MTRHATLALLLGLSLALFGCTSSTNGNAAIQTAVTISPTASSTIAVTLAATPQPTITAGGTNTPQGTPAMTVAPTTSASQTTKITVGATDSGFSGTQANARAGDGVQLTVNVGTDDVYFGGLQIKCQSVGFDSGKVPPGGTAVALFTMPATPVVCSAFWPSSGVKKGDLTINPA